MKNLMKHIESLEDDISQIAAAVGTLLLLCRGHAMPNGIARAIDEWTRQLNVKRTVLRILVSKALQTRFGSQFCFDHHHESQEIIGAYI